ncbi:hypothetical protein [Sphingomonas sp. Ant20]|uniref:hypothetical protein n=1 Tax=Sphingomonas sp. Ant20 TaxID=104605 RepID=UPI000FE14AF1|nr:hypothetical protein [Sphingomonas sp. Ant20]
MTTGFATSAFAILELSLRSSKDAINEAVDRLAFESDRDPADLDAARARLLSARDRVEEEIAWLPELPPSEARRAASAALAGNLDALRSAWKATSGLAQLNIGAAIVSLKPDPALSVEIIKSGLLWDSRSTLQTLQESRAIAGSPPIGEDLWKRAVDKHLDYISFKLVAPFAYSSKAAEELSKDILEYRAGQSEVAASLLEGLIRNYRRLVEPKLSLIAGDIENNVSNIKEDPQRATSREALVNQIGKWAALRRPVLLHEASRGLEDEKSVSLARSIRSLAIELANDHSAFAAAKELTEALRAGFAYLPTFGEKLDEDSETLAGLLASQSDARHLEPLAATCHAALDQPKAFASSVNAGNLTQNGTGLAANLANAFKSATFANVSDPNIPWLMVRNIAIELHNEHDKSEVALSLVEWLLAANPPPSVRSKLEADRRAAKEAIDTNRLALAVKSGRLSDARTILASISPDAVGGRVELRKLQDGIAERLRRRNGKWIGWAVTGAIAIFAIAQADRKPSSQPEPSSLVTDMSVPEGGGTINDGSGSLPADSAATEAASSLDAGDERMPAPNSYGVLSRAELRWCSFESARLSALEGRVPNNAISGFNSAVQEFNSRCYGARYAESDKAAVDSEVADSAARIRSEADAKMSVWASEPQGASAPPPSRDQPLRRFYDDNSTQETPPASTQPDTQQGSEPSEPYESEPTPNG